MIDTKTLRLFKARYDELSLSDNKNVGDAMRVLTLGMVVGTDDPMQEGRLQIFCPAYNDSPKKVQQLPWAAYIMPFGGSVDNPLFARGVEDGEQYTQGAVHYGMWGVPELGAHVLVGCVDGDPRRRFWLGCIPEHQETHTMFNGRFDWSSKDGTPDGPLSSTKGKIQPLYDNLSKAFVDRKSREWKSRGADFQAMSIPKHGEGFPSKNKGAKYLDETYEDLASHEEDEWVKSILGAHGYDWSAFKNMSGMRSSRVYGMSTPGFHSFSMDDRPFNSRMKLRTATGHMLLMDDTNERIYLMTNKGNNWVEMDTNGNIDIFSSNRISITGTKDMNFNTSGTLRFHAGNGIHMYAGHNLSGDTPTLAEPPKIGEIRIQSESEFNLTATNIRNKSIENTYNEVGINQYNKVGDSMFSDIEKDYNLRTLTGDYISTVNGSLLETVKTDSKRFTEGNSAVSARGDAEYHSFGGKMSIGSMNDVSVKSASGNVDIEATGQNTDNGNVRINTPRSQMNVGDNGLEGLTSKSSSFKSGETYQVEITSEVTGKPSSSSRAPLSFSGIPDPGNCNIGTLPPVNKTGVLTPKEVAQVCYNAGFRGQDLIIATSVAMAESSNNPRAINPNGASRDESGNLKYTGAYGLFQVLELTPDWLNKPTVSGSIDRLRDNRQGQLLDPNRNAKVAYQIFSKANPPGKWSIGKWESLNGKNPNFASSIQDSVAAVSELCGVMMGSPVEEAFGISVDESYNSEEMTGIDMISGVSAPSSNTLLYMSASEMTLQSATTVDFKDLATGMFNSHTEMTTRINANTAGINMLSYYSALLTPAISTLASSLNKSFSMPFSFDLGSIISSLYSSAMPPQLQSAFATIGELNSAIDSMGGLGMSLPLDMQGMVSQLAGNTAVLQALGLPTDLQFPINPGVFGGLSIIQQLTRLVQSDSIDFLELPEFRELVNNIYLKYDKPLGGASITQQELVDILGGL